MPQSRTDAELMLLFEQLPRQGDCWIWQGSTSVDGYGKIQHRSRTWRAHRLSYFIHNGEIPESLCVRHHPTLCNNPLCVNPNHLTVGTHSDNMMDRREAGTHVSSRRKLTMEDAQFIRDSPLSHRKLAALFSVSPPTIYSIKHNHHYQ